MFRTNYTDGVLDPSQDVQLGQSTDCYLDNATGVFTTGSFGLITVADDNTIVSFKFVSAGQNPLASGRKFGIDKIVLTKQEQLLLETESTQGNHSTTGAANSYYCSTGVESGDVSFQTTSPQHVRFEAKNDGDFEIFNFNVPSGTYMVDVSYEARNNRGIFTLFRSHYAGGVLDSSNDEQLGEPLDCYLDHPTGVFKTASFGTMVVTGDAIVSFKFVSSGMNPASSGRKFGIDKIILTKDLEVIAEPEDPADVIAVENDRDALSLGFSSGDSENHVTGDISLPTSGANGTTITWSSGNKAVLSDEGTVTRPKYTETDATVNLTASVAKNNVVRNRVFVLTVKKLEAEPDASGSIFANFITRNSDKLMDGDYEFKFISTNMPDILQIITNKRFELENRMRLPDEFELRDAVETVKQMYGQAIRTFMITATRTDDQNYMVKVDPNSTSVTFNEDAMRVLDKLLEICNEEGIRLIIPLVNNPTSILRGDINTYGEDFYIVGSDANLRFKSMIDQLMERTNVYTGVKYKDDKAIMAWESGNELVIGTDANRKQWLHDIAAYIKSRDPNHLLMDGRNKPDDIYYTEYDEFLDDPNIDIVSYHTYVGITKSGSDTGPVNSLKDIATMTKNKKPLVIGEVAMYTTSAQLSDLIKIMTDSLPNANPTGEVYTVSGLLWWGHRFHNRDGGFYKHSDAGSQHEDLNWPGFPEQSAYNDKINEEISRQTALADGAYKLYKNDANAVRPPLPVPKAPTLLPISDVGHISWQGSTGAQYYIVERAEDPAGTWTSVDSVSSVMDSAYISDNMISCYDIFNDATATLGATYYYRVKAVNSSGQSPASNVVGPVTVNSNWLIDEMFSFNKLHNRESNTRIISSYAHTDYLEDLALLKSIDSASTSIEYALPGTLKSAKVYVHGGTAVLLGSADGQVYYPLSTQAVSFGGNTRTLYRATATVQNMRFFKVELESGAIGRVEIEYLGDDMPVPPKIAVPEYKTPVTVVEAELATYDAFSTFDPPVNQTGGTLAEASNGRYSIFDAQAPGHWVIYYVPVERAGTYKVEISYNAQSARGIYELFINNEETRRGEPEDCYAGDKLIRRVEYGEITVTEPGNIPFKFVIVGKNELSGGYKIGIDAIKLTKMPANVAPVTSNSNLAVTKDTAKVGTLPVVDENNDTLRYTIIAHPLHGTLQLSDDGSYTYTPHQGYTGSDIFSWKVNDGWVNSNTSYVNIVISGVSGESTPADDYTPSIPSTTPPAPAIATEIDGRKVDIGADITVEEKDGIKVSTVTLDQKKLENLLGDTETGVTIAIPVPGESDNTIAELNGQMLEKMSEKDAMLELASSIGSYALPAQQVIEKLLTMLDGNDLDLRDVKVQIEINTPESSIVKIAEGSAEIGGFAIMVPPVEFKVNIVVDGKTTEIADFSQYIERSIAIPEGVDPSKVTTAIIVEEDGTVRHVPTRIVIENGKYYAKIKSLSNSVYVLISNVKHFNDVAAHAAESVINELASMLIISGVGDGRFQPDRSITRAEFAVLVSRALGLKSNPKASNFSDIKTTDYYRGHIGALAERALIVGHNGLYRPNDPINRKEALAIIARAMTLAGIDTAMTDSEAASILSKYIDGSRLDVWARKSTALCITYGIFQGETQDKLNADVNITRAEAATIIYKMLKKAALID